MLAPLQRIHQPDLQPEIPRHAILELHGDQRIKSEFRQRDVGLEPFEAMLQHARNDAKQGVEQ